MLAGGADDVEDPVNLLQSYLDHHEVGVRDEHSLQNGDVGELCGVDGVGYVSVGVHRALSLEAGIGCNHRASDCTDKGVVTGALVAEATPLNDVQSTVHGLGEKVPSTGEPDGVDLSDNAHALKMVECTVITIDRDVED